MAIFGEIIDALFEFDCGRKTKRPYMMACLAYVRFGSISNSNVRAVFGLEEDTKGMVKASRVIKDTLNSGRIKPVDKNTSPRFMRYIPIWG